MPLASGAQRPGRKRVVLDHAFVIGLLEGRRLMSDVAGRSLLDLVGSADPEGRTLQEGIRPYMELATDPVAMAVL
jgi:hypothetical protein